MINACCSPGNCVLNRKELAKSLPKTQPEIAFDKMAERQIRIFQFDGMCLLGWV
jgi:hypothetical protein